MDRTSFYEWKRRFQTQGFEGLKDLPPKREARAEIDRILGMGGVSAAIENGYMKSALVRSMSERVSRINTGQQIVVG